MLIIDDINVNPVDLNRFWRFLPTNLSNLKNLKELMICGNHAKITNSNVISIGRWIEKNISLKEIVIWVPFMRVFHFNHLLSSISSNKYITGLSLYLPASNLIRLKPLTKKQGKPLKRLNLAIPFELAGYWHIFDLIRKVKALEFLRILFYIDHSKNSLKLKHP